MRKFITFSLILALTISCESKKNEELSLNEDELENSVELTDAQLKNSDLKTGKIIIQNISSILKVNGKIDVPPQNIVSVSIPMGGFLKSSKLLTGMHIIKNEIIAVIEDIEYLELQQNYLVSKALFNASEAEFIRQEKFYTNKAISEKDFQDTQTKFLTNKITLKTLELKLKLLGINAEILSENNIKSTINIYSPFDGYVTKVNMNIGKYILPSDVLFELVNPDDIHLELTIFEKDLDKISLGQKLLTFNNIYPNKKYECEIILIGKNISDERSIDVHCHFEKYDKFLIPGMYMNAEVEVSTNKAFVIPNEGLVRFEAKQYVFTQNSDKMYEMIEVTTQNNENGFTQIIFSDTAGIKNKTFVTHGAYTLLMKMKNTEEE